MTSDFLGGHHCAQMPLKPGEDRLALEKEYYWPNGSEIVVNMWGQSDVVRSKVKQFAEEWTRYANITFKWMERDAPGDSDIRISFDRDGYWSYIGTNCHAISQDQPTMNYGGMTDDMSDLEFSTAVCHEFGHALGFIHEQASPVANIQWNKPVVQYSYDATMTLDGSSAPWNRVISNLDKVFAMRLYPKEGIQRTTTDGVYFINRERNGFEASGIAYYSHFGNNDGQQPDTYVEVSNGSFAWWENGGEATFGGSGHVIKWNLADDAGRSPLYTRVGFAEKEG
ncbi:peptidase m12 [Fusarium langsethiae]|uniref:Peptidase m12 n=1 Tax=Fusarium langsethiae TaxID=179993 RepID=A0A0N0DDJ0_FUSLA|nr:peptidase m12 [Fusarium langsethiae]